MEKLETCNSSLVQNLDLGGVIDKMHRSLGWNLADLKKIEALYKNFLILNLKYPNERIIPSEEVDEMWHNHILDTIKYQEDCAQVFGFYLHHYPYLGMRGKEDYKNLLLFFEKTQLLHTKEFGYPVYHVRYGFIKRSILRFLDFLGNLFCKQSNSGFSIL